MEGSQQIRGALNALMTNGLSGHERYRVAEVGVWRGENALEMILTLREKLEKLFLIDHYKTTYPHPGLGLDPDSNYGTAKKRLAQFEHLCEWHIGDQMDAAKQFEDNSLHFVYIDGDHQYYEHTRALMSWYPKVMPGCLIGGHDAHMDSVRYATNHFVKERKLIGPVHFGGPWAPDWWFYK